MGERSARGSSSGPRGAQQPAALQQAGIGTARHDYGRSAWSAPSRMNCRTTTARAGAVPARWPLRAIAAGRSRQLRHQRAVACVQLARTERRGAAQRYAFRRGFRAAAPADRRASRCHRADRAALALPAHGHARDALRGRAPGPGGRCRAWHASHRRAGPNIGFRDVAALTELVVAAHAAARMSAPRPARAHRRGAGRMR